MSSSHKLKINAERLLHLEAVISYYDNNVASQSQGTHTAVNAWRPLETVEATLSSVYDTINPAKALQDWHQGNKAVINEFNQKFDRDVTQQINKAFEDLYTSGQRVSRSKVIQVGPLGLQFGGTVGGLLNAESVEQAASIILADCLPCSVRMESIRLLPDLSFLDQLIETVASLISAIQALVQSILHPPMSDKISLCATLNLLDFTCMPDLQALMLLVGKSLVLSLKLPTLKIPSLSQIGSLIVMPILGAVVNLLLAWANLIFKPVECILEALEALIRKFRISGKDIGASVGLDVSGGGVSYGDKQILKGVEIKPSRAMGDKIFDKLDTTKRVDSILQALEQIKKYLLGIKSQMQNHLNKIIQKFQAAMNNGNKGLFEFVQSLQEILKGVALLQMIVILKDLFTAKSLECKSKEEAVDAVKEAIPTMGDKFIPGAYTRDSGGDSAPPETDREFDLTPEEVEALGLSGDPSVTITPEENRMKVIVNYDFSLRDCITPTVHRKSFLNIDSLLSDYGIK